MDREKGAEGCWYSKHWPYGIGPSVAYQKESINIRRERENVMKQKIIIVIKKKCLRIDHVLCFIKCSKKIVLEDRQTYFDNQHLFES